MSEHGKIQSNFSILDPHGRILTSCAIADLSAGQHNVCRVSMQSLTSQLLPGEKNNSQPAEKMLINDLGLKGPRPSGDLQGQNWRLSPMNNPALRLLPNHHECVD